MRADAEVFVDADAVVNGKSSEGSWMVREEWILGGTTAVCIWSILRRRSSPQDIAMMLPVEVKRKDETQRGGSGFSIWWMVLLFLGDCREQF